MEVRPFEKADQVAVISLWDRCGLLRPWNDPVKDIARKLDCQPELFLVGVCDGSVVATVMAGYEGHRGWINYLAVEPERRQQGLGRAIMAHAERLLERAGCPKVNLQIRATNRAAIGFYQSLGYRVDEVVSMGRRLVADEMEGR